MTKPSTSAPERPALPPRQVVGYKFALNPTPTQERALLAHAGAARFAYNWALGALQANWSQREAEKTYGIADGALTPPMNTSHFGLIYAWNAHKYVAVPWWREVGKYGPETGLRNFAAAMSNWRASRKGTRAGKTVGFPKRKTRHKTTPSIWWAGDFRCERRRVKVPVIGKIRLHETADRLVDLLESGQARCKSVTIRFERGRWFAAFAVETQVRRSAPTQPDAVVGVDLGVKVLATLSTGEVIANPRHLEHARKVLRRRSRIMARRQGPDRRAGQQPSKRWTRAAEAVGRTHHQVANRRTDALHKATTSLTGKYGTLVLEDLNVSGMVRLSRVARGLSDSALREFRRQIEYKASWRGGSVVIVDRWYPSSKTCSGCGAVKAKLAMSERSYRCDACGVVLDRDLNAALNLAKQGQAQVAASGAETQNGRGVDRKTGSGPQVTVKRLPGSSMPMTHETGTAPLQGGAAA